MSKFDKIILENLIEQTGVPILEQEPDVPAGEPMADEQPAPVETPAPVTTPDVPAIKLDMLDLARKALFVDPSVLSQQEKGILTNVVTQDTYKQIEDIISHHVTVEEPVDTGGGEIDYNNNM